MKHKSISRFKLSKTKHKKFKAYITGCFRIYAFYFFLENILNEIFKKIQKTSSNKNQINCRVKTHFKFTENRLRLKKEIKIDFNLFHNYVIICDFELYEP